MGFIKKIWKDRISEFPTRRSLTKTDGSSELVTVARSEGMISEEGDAFSAENMNDFENRVANGFSELNEKLMLQNSASLGYPDYENVTLLAANKKASGIIAESGYLFVNESGASSEMAVKINSKVTVNVRLANSKLIPVFAGDSWEITSFTANAYLSFIPLRRLQN